MVCMVVTAVVQLTRAGLTELMKVIGLSDLFDLFDLLLRDGTVMSLLLLTPLGLVLVLLATWGLFVTLARVAPVRVVLLSVDLLLLLRFVLDLVGLAWDVGEPLQLSAIIEVRSSLGARALELTVILILQVLALLESVSTSPTSMTRLLSVLNSGVTLVTLC